MEIKNFGDFVKYIRRSVLDPNFNDLRIDVYDHSICFNLYECSDVAICYGGDIDDITVEGYADMSKIPYTEIKDCYGIMVAIREYHEILDDLIDNK